LFRSITIGVVTDSAWLKLHYPLYWHYDVLQGLVVLSRLSALPNTRGTMRDARMREAVDIVGAKCQSNGRLDAVGEGLAIVTGLML
jgi:hypothetical protein